MSRLALEDVESAGFFDCDGSPYSVVSSERALGYTPVSAYVWNFRGHFRSAHELRFETGFDKYVEQSIHMETAE